MVAIAITGSIPGGALAQEPAARSIVVDSTVACATCSIVLDSLFTASLPGTEFRLVPSDAYNMRVAQDGSFVLSLIESPGTVVRWSKSADQVTVHAHQLPGIEPPPGYAAASISSDGRLQLVSRGWWASLPLEPGGEGMARVLDYTNVWDMVSVGGRTVLSGWLPTPAAAGFPFHLEGPAGHMGSFGPVFETYRRMLLEGRTRLAASGDSAFWSIDPRGRVLQQWTLDQRLNLVMVLPALPTDPDAASGKQPQGGALPDSRPAPTDPAVVGAWEDEDGLVWVLTRIPREGYVLPASPPDIRAPASSQDGSADIVVEAIDPASGLLLTRSQTAANLVGLRGGPIVLGLAVDPTGRQVFVVHRVRLER